MSFNRQTLTKEQAIREKAAYEAKGHTVWSMTKVIAPNGRDAVWSLSVSLDSDANRGLWS